MPDKKNVVIIGAGIAGTSAAAALADTCDVTILEQETQPGYHATGRSAATWAPYYGPDVIQHLTALSLPLLSSPDKEFSDSSFTSPKGELMLGKRGNEEDIETHMALGMDRLSIDEALEKVPLIKPDSVDYILYTDNMLDIDVNALHQAYIKYMKRNGGKIILSATVTAITQMNGSWKIVTDSDTLECDVVINAAGAWADHIAMMAGISTLGIQPRRRTAAIVPYAEHVNMSTWPMVFGAGESFYCTPFGSGLMISPADETPVAPHDAWPDDIDVARGIDEFQQYIDHDVKKIESQWAGLRTFSADGAPVIGFSSDATGFFWLAGQGGYGIQTSPAIAALCRQLICGPKAPSTLFGQVDSAAFSHLHPDRFI